VVLSGVEWKVKSGTQIRNRDPLCGFDLIVIKSRNGTSTHHSRNNTHYEVKVTAKVFALISVEKRSIEKGHS
jgi:hypothetical protein